MVFKFIELRYVGWNNALNKVKACKEFIYRRQSVHEVNKSSWGIGLSVGLDCIFN